MSNIPHARRILIDLYRKLIQEGNQEDAHAIGEAIGNLFRRAPVRKSPTRSNPVTINTKNNVIELADTTDLTAAQIAAIFNINPGRVTEILQERRGVN
ncbi:hypothetical protein FHS55_000216 [Angulomicrobium tetraedrale]|uniref:Uncharacterized protein n=1 Tax=Ancylobacter tetraedralis TaxID=217068 RepID=A0A839Z562_9HYPH|nr:hypothetical protein [Ancylobacter tetraedralis]MBB3769630.1 hypothetical protein [Ancylobacter tetraedralis]